MITRDFYYVAPGKHVTHFRSECASYLRSYNLTGRKGSMFYMAQPKGKTLCDHCQAIEKRAKKAARNGKR